MANKVFLDMTGKEATLLWCQGIRASAGIKDAAREQNLPLLTYYASFAVSILDQIAEAAPEELKPDGSETNKP